MAIDFNLKVLAVDDSPIMQKIIVKNLKDIGFSNIITAVNGVDGLEKLHENDIDLVISDWNMPEMDGLEFLVCVRAEDRLKEIPFIMATAQGDKQQQETVKKAGGNGLIAKPFDNAELIAFLEDIFDGGSKEQVRRKPEVVDGKVQLKMAHIQITDHLVLGMLKHQINEKQVTPKHFDLELVQMQGWNPVANALESGDVDGAFVLAPIAMDLFGFGTPINMTLLAHKNGSIFVRSSRGKNVESPREFFHGKVHDIPHKMSIHNMLSHQYLKEQGLRPGVPGENKVDVAFEVVPPILMPGILKENEDVAGFMVAEPIGTNAIAKGIAEKEFLSGEQWENHPCCICSMQTAFIEDHPKAMQEFTDLLVQAGKTIMQKKFFAAPIAVNFLDPDRKLGLTQQILFDVLDMEKGITMDDLYPVLDDLDEVQKYMHNEMGIGVMIDLEKFADLRFAKKACGVQ